MDTLRKWISGHVLTALLTFALLAAGLQAARPTEISAQGASAPI